MWYAVYDEATSALQSVGTVLADPLTPGLAVVELGEDRPDLSAVVWDPTTRSYIAAPATARTISAVDYRERFTFAERVAIKQAAFTDAEVAVLEDDVNARVSAGILINLDSAQTIGGLALLVSKALIGAERPAEVRGLA